MRTSATLVLLPGTNPILGATQTIILPEVHTDLKLDDLVTLESQKGEFIGLAVVKSVEIDVFALLQNNHFALSAHPEMTNWETAFAVLPNLVEEFSQCDHVTVVTIETKVLAEPGLVVNQVQALQLTGVAPEDTPRPDLEADYAALDAFHAELTGAADAGAY